MGVVVPFEEPRDASETLKPLLEIVAEDMQAVNRIILDKAVSDVELIPRLAHHLIDSGGKRLRPMLTIASARLCGYVGQGHVRLAAAVEFMHTATLLHDDVVDESNLRRGRQTANAQFGNAASVLVGDFLYSRAFQMMVGVGSPRVMAVMANATNVIAEGEVLQLMNVHDVATGEEQYLRVIRYKTAKLFQAATQVGAILGEASPQVEQALTDYGMHLGTAFQLIDDVLDYSGDHQETGKNLGDDLAEGKPTLPLIYAMKQGTPAERDVIRHAIEGGGKADLAGVLGAIARTGALEYSRAKATEEAALASRLIEVLPDSACKDSLLQLALFSVERTY